ncbi:low affinity iron permease family protein [Tabrizicola sp.]|uniref:low affinity iron permease family protein n=1 Tax=Tabrizicola sp. TaxID=2005166 RepID=UPI001A409BEF|nr:low affinity iron permease family protein [Tabrizicola sp.]MBL9073340.1 low affinity iron permease family protein [Tabrizicola sp.]
MTDKSSVYTRTARWIAQLSGRPITFLLAVATIVVWMVSGPVFAFSDTWQLVINTGTTIITFLMVFLIQNTQNRDTVAMQLKLDELIRATKGAHLSLLDLEELEEKELAAFVRQYEELAAIGRAQLDKGKSDTGTPEVVSRTAPPEKSLSQRKSASAKGRSVPRAGS